MFEWLLNKTFTEHHNYPHGEDISMLDITLFRSILFLGKNDRKCVEINYEKKSLHTSYYIGTDWLIRNNTAIYIAPKLNRDGNQVHYLKMLLSCLQHTEVIDHVGELFEIKFDEPYIAIDQRQDLITPLLVLQFLQVMRSIVRKGLKKTYYPVEENLNARIKGKPLVGQTIKQNLLKNKHLHTYCRYEVFGVDGMENRILKKALHFVQRYLSTVKMEDATKHTTDVFNYIWPAFQGVSEEVDQDELRHTKVNTIYKEYIEGLRLAKLILKRFGFNIDTINNDQRIKLPPFWIDMSKLFELYVLGLLKDRYKSSIRYGKKEAKGEYGLPDFLLVNGTEKMIIDTKYKPLYQWQDYEIGDIRQLSAYARDKRIREKLKLNSTDTPDCLIIYPDQQNGADHFIAKDLKSGIISQFTQFYKFPVRLPG